ncbi:hypothetical protein GH714_032863 [Hevea brasiliensis]|uniref:Uncharacterized protein n=1 Tax=Hevea brasiliensis TaxID=3981 RepID=A0A6A6L202_HEVBR|nr:hypothetical protein GH714_032863 [Hevea brasiliensis]
MTKCLRSERNVSKVKPGVAYAVLTSNNPRKVVVSEYEKEIEIMKILTKEEYLAVEKGEAVVSPEGHPDIEELRGTITMEDRKQE